MFPVRQFRRAGAFRGTPLLVAASFCFLILATGSASSATDTAPHRDHGRGHWFKRSCAAAPTGFASCDAQVVTNAAGSPLAASAPPASALGPAQFAGAYSLPTSAPSNATIAIIDAYDNPNIESDLAAFSSYYGLPACTTANGCFRKVNQVGGTSYPSKNTGWGLEIALDVETAHEICQSCKILLVEAISPSYGNLGAAENEAVALGASVVSNSWGGAESSTESSLDTYFNHPGVVITASAGDSGYGARYPAASPYVVAVGGTSLSLNADNSSKSETAWSGTGSGCSAYEAKPSSQAGYGCARRTIADVSADADPNSGAAIYDTYGYSGWVQVGGTSLASPLIAAVYALSGNTSNGAAPYANPTALHDVTSGSNGSCSPSYLCTAGVGYDGPTGLGSPNGLAAFGGGAPPPPAPDFSVAVSPSSQTVTQGQSASYTVTMTPNSAVGSGDSVTVAATSTPGDLTLSGCSSPLTTASPTCTLTATTSGAATSSHTLAITGAGSAGLPTHDASATLGIQPPLAPDYALAVSPSTQTVTQGQGTSYTVTMTPNAAFGSGSVSVAAASAPADVTLSGCTSPLTTASPTCTLTAATIGAAASTHALTITGTGSAGLPAHGASASLVVQAPVTGDFSLSISPASQFLFTPRSTTVTVTIKRLNGFTGSVVLSVSGLPPTFTSSFSANPASTSSTLTITAPKTSRRTVTFTVTGTSNGITHSQSGSLSVF